MVLDTICPQNYYFHYKLFINVTIAKSSVKLLKLIKCFK